MKLKALSLLSVVVLVALVPLAAQVPEDDPAAEPVAVQQEQPAATGDQPMTESHQPATAESESGEGQVPTGEQAAQGELPKTASPLPLLALIGGLSLAAAVGLRVQRGRS